MDITNTECLFICVGLLVQPPRHLILNTKAESAVFIIRMMKQIKAYANREQSETLGERMNKE